MFLHLVLDETTTTVNLLAKKESRSSTFLYQVAFSLCDIWVVLQKQSTSELWEKCTRNSTFEGVVINVLLSYQRALSWVMIYRKVFSFFSLWVHCQCRCFNNLLLHPKEKIVSQFAIKSLRMCFRFIYFKARARNAHHCEVTEQLQVCTRRLMYI